MEASAIKTLLIDDELDLLDVSKQFLEMDGSISVDTAASAAHALKLIETREYDVVISDYQMPRKDGIQLLKALRAMGNTIPFILFTGKGREEVAIEALNSGADFYLQKGGDPKAQFAELANMVKQAYAREQKELALRISEERYRSLFENSVDAVMLTTIDFESVISANPSACKMFGMTEKEIRRTGIKGLIVDGKAWEFVLRRLNQTGIIKGEFTYKRKDGTTFTGETTHGVLTGHYGIARISMIVRDVTERELSDEIIGESAARLQTYMDNAPEGIFIIDSNGDYQDVNRTACSMLRYSREELLSLNIADIADKSKRQQSEEKFQQLLETGAMTQETILVRKDGIGVPVFLNAAELPNKRYIAFCTDITERERAEKKVAESEQRYRQLMEMANDAILIHEISQEGPGRLIEVNEKSCQLLGYRKDELLRMAISDIDVPEQKGNVPAIMNELSSARSAFFTTELLANGGRRIPVEASASLIDLKGQEVVLAIVRDITERKRAEGSLRDTKEYLENLLNYANAPIIVWGPDFTISVFNHAFERLTGMRWDQVVGKPVEILFPEEMKSDFMTLVKKTIAGQRWENVEIPVRGGDGDVRIILWNSATLSNPNGEAIAAIAQGHDVTECKRFETALLESEERYRAFFATSQDCVFITTLDGSWIDFNDVAVRLFGYDSREDLKKTDIPHLYANPHDRDNHARFIRENGYSFEYPVDLRRKDGTIINTLITTVARKDSSGNIVSFQGSIRDITNRKLNEDALRESERKYRLLAENVHDVIWTLDIATMKFTYISPSVEKLSGFTAEENMQMTLKEILHPESYVEITRHLPTWI
jgi:PAS domain S-box-containing protein